MDKIVIEQNNILDYMKQSIQALKIGKERIINAKYHHNTFYSDAASICRYGILTVRDLVNLKIRNYPEDMLERMSDTNSHVNGINCISLSVVGLKDIYRGEDVYNPLSPDNVDFLISNDLEVKRCSINYGNEFLCTQSINIDKIKSVDIRLLSLIKKVENSKDKNELLNLIKKYNCLINIAKIMRTSQLDIPLREMSYEDDSILDIDKLSFVPKLVLKKESI